MNDLKTSTNLQCSDDVVFFLIFIRSLIWIGLLVLTPILLLPRCQRMFEEFGITIPKLTQLTFAFGNSILMYGFIYGIVTIPAILAWQLVLFFLNGRRIGSQLVVVDWVLISIATVFLVISLGMPIAAIASGLNG